MQNDEVSLTIKEKDGQYSCDVEVVNDTKLEAWVHLVISACSSMPTDHVMLAKHCYNLGATRHQHSNCRISARSEQNALVINGWRLGEEPKRLCARDNNVQIPAYKNGTNVWVSHEGQTYHLGDGEELPLPEATREATVSEIVQQTFADPTRVLYARVVHVWLSLVLCRIEGFKRRVGIDEKIKTDKIGEFMICSISTAFTAVISVLRYTGHEYLSDFCACLAYCVLFVLFRHMKGSFDFAVTSEHKSITHFGVLGYGVSDAR